MKIIEFSKFHILSTNVSKQLNIAIQLVTHSIWQLFFEAKELSHLKSVNEMTGEDVYTFSGCLDHSLLNMWLGNERMVDRESERFSVSCLQIHVLRRFWRVIILCVPFFGPPSDRRNKVTWISKKIELFTCVQFESHFDASIFSIMLSVPSYFKSIGSVVEVL